MELKLTRKINRKNFFTTTGLSAAGFFLMKSFPFRHLSNKDPQKVSIKINPESVSRKKTGEKNV